MIVIIYLWLDTSVEYEFRARNVQMKLQSGDHIDEGTSFISVIVIRRG